MRELIKRNLERATKVQSPGPPTNRLHIINTKCFCASFVLCDINHLPKEDSKQCQCQQVLIYSYITIIDLLIVFMAFYWLCIIS